MKRHLKWCQNGLKYFNFNCLRLLNNVILIKTRGSPFSGICELNRFLLSCLGHLVKTCKLFGFLIIWPSVPYEGYWAYFMKVIERTLWRLLSVPYEGYWEYLMKVIERTLWRLLSIPYEGYWAYLMKGIERTLWRLLSVPYEGYSRNERILWRLFQKRVVCTKL